MEQNSPARTDFQDPDTSPAIFHLRSFVLHSKRVSTSGFGWCQRSKQMAVSFWVALQSVQLKQSVLSHDLLT